MGLDDVADGCPLGEHLWRLRAVRIHRGGSTSEYACDRCEQLLFVGPGQPHPETC